MARKESRYRFRKRRDRDGRAGWLDVFRSLGEALLDVFKAEADLLWEYWRAWGKSVAVAVALVAVALFLLFWISGFLSVAAVHGLMVLLGWKLWQAALLIAGVLLGLVLGLALTAYFLARRIDNPMAVTRQRLGDHRGWFSERILGETPQLTRGGEDDGSSDTTDGASAGAAGEPPAAR